MNAKRKYGVKLKDLESEGKRREQVLSILARYGLCCYSGVVPALDSKRWKLELPMVTPASPYLL